MGEPVDLIVVGAGPAGMAAGATALAGGLRVALVDAGTTVGGQFWRPPPEHARTPIPDADPHQGARTHRALRRALAEGRAQGRLLLHLAHPVWSVTRDGEGFAVHAVDRSRDGAECAVTVRAPRLLVATGAYDRQLPFPGWELPGVLTAGGLQALLKGGGVAAGRRVVLGGTGPFLLPVATGLAAHGVKVVAVCEAAGPLGWLRHPGPLLRNPAKLAEGARYGAALARHRIPVLPRTAITAAEGTDRVTSVTLAALAPDGTPRPGTERRVEADAVGVGWGFAPQLDLLIPLGCALVPAPDGNAVAAVDDGQRTSVPGLYAAGEVCGVGGAPLAVAEGHLAVASVLADLEAGAGAGAVAEAGPEAGTEIDTGARPSVNTPRRIAALRARARAHRAFARAMALVHPLPPAWGSWLTDRTVVCRCEEVTADQVLAARNEHGAQDHRQVKQLTRAGMGWCQGRICGPAVHCLAAAPGPYTPTERLIATPVTLGALADLDTDRGAADR
ncbi:NAD(P)/FAD-dependent oxidoreductase [Streptomyces sp. NPDC046887]|uniref:NAD(P)/FAD-dependent oxidoreductase n=1 Tax=Streptomyces sp. NPDC046887 TaxID=3155472 RepID=UPI0033CCAA8E